MEDYKGILLESGTGEVEILEFIVQGKRYAINVVKVKEILRIEDVNKIPNPNPAIAGIALVRGEVISVIDMKYVLEKEQMPEGGRMTLLCEFNKIKVAFSVDEVVGIHRIKWEQLQKPDSIIENTIVIGNINYNNRILLLLDFEKIVMDISPETGISQARIDKLDSKPERALKKIVLSDDSPLIRKLLKDVLTKAGYTNMTFFNDGKAALEYVQELKEKFEENMFSAIDLLVTDIEMPVMDGHTLTRTIKEDKVMRRLPVIIFSSLITGDLLHKGYSVGADAQMSKPEIGHLIELIDSLVGIE
ncbi:MAG: chemotaxis protein [Peptostreptococcaceae bacterium]|nr:chemotaxis protein [Peptostreptococcaceae bacterium]